MPRVQFSCPPAKINISKNMSTPKKYQDLKDWFKEARKAIPQIPNLDRSDWFIWQENVTLSTVLFELRDSVGNKCAVIIERRKSQMVA